MSLLRRDIAYRRQDQGPPVNAVVLIGGSSRRMGRPKQILSRGGLTLVEIAVSAVERVIRQVVLAGSGPIPPGLHRFERLSDPPGIAGPMAGLLAAMRRAPEAAWVVVACDMPRVREQAVVWLLEQRGPGVRAVLPKNTEGGVEPLLAVYEPSMKGELERRFENGRFGLRHLAESKGVRCPIPPDDVRDAWMNVNTMEEFESSVVIDV